MNFCGNCGTKLQQGSKFCGKCGFKLSTDNSNGGNEINYESRNFSENNNTIKKIFDGATEKINKYTGETDVVEVNLKDLFSEVTKKHTQEEAEKIFISGTASTTPSIDEVSENWIKPWLFSRVFLVCFVSFVVLWYILANFESSSNVIPGFIFLGAFTMPLSALIFFFESNSLRNISILKTIEMFFVGGVFSLLLTFVIHEIFPPKATIFGELTTTGAITVGAVEEIAKLIVVMYFVNKFKAKYILNGLLIGCAVGAGFAAFETAGYILNFFDEALSVTFIRAITAIGGHLAWTALAGGALVMVKKSEDISLNHILNSNFLFFFTSVVAMHSVWDMEIPIITNPYLKICILVVLVWIEIFVLMSAGLKEVHRIKRNI